MAITPNNPVAYGFHRTARWRRLRKLQLTQEPLCKLCLERGIVRAATVADDIEPHKGSWTKFVSVSSRAFAMSATIQQSSRLRGYHRAIGPDGLPTDPTFNRQR